MSRNTDNNSPQLYLKCESCATYFEYNGHKRRRWCSAKCKMRAWRALDKEFGV